MKTIIWLSIWRIWCQNTLKTYCILIIICLWNKNTLKAYCILIIICLRNIPTKSLIKTTIFKRTITLSLANIFKQMFQWQIFHVYKLMRTAHSLKIHGVNACVFNTSCKPCNKEIVFISLIVYILACLEKRIKVKKNLN